MTRSISTLALLALAASAHAYTYNPNDFATATPAYTKGSGVRNDFFTGLPFSNPTTALGRPSIDTTGDGTYIAYPSIVPVVPVYPPLHATDIVSIGKGGSITLQFSHPVYNDPANPNGLDFTIFANAFFTLSSGGGYTNGNPSTSIASVPTGTKGHGYSTTVSVSQDGTTWYAFTTSPPNANGIMPTLGRVYNPANPDPTLGSWNQWWSQPTDPTVPLPPTITNTSFNGQTLTSIATTYGQSAGGTSFDISALGLAWIQYVRIDNPSSAADTPSIDAVSIVATSNQWTGSSGSNWSAPANWSATQVPGNINPATFNPATAVGTPITGHVDATANFKQAPTNLTGPIAVTLDAPQNIATLNFDNPLGYSLTGSQTLTLQASDNLAVITVATGNHTVATPLTFASPTTITLAASTTLTLSGPLTTSANPLTKAGPGTLALSALPPTPLTISAGTVMLLPNSGLTHLTSLTLSGGTLDINNNALLDTSDPLPTITAAIHANTLISSSTAGQSRSTGITALAAVSGSDYLATRGPNATFFGAPVSPTNTLVQYTYLGDTNLEGTITPDDYLALNLGYLFNLSGWTHGDFFYSGSITVADFIAIDKSYQYQSGPLANALIQQHAAWFGPAYLDNFPTTVPEPASLALLGSSALLIRRKR